MTSLPEGMTGKALALGLCVLMLAMIYLIVVEPLFGFYQSGAQRLQERLDLVERLRRSAHDLPRLRAAADQWRARSGADNLLLDGASDAIAAATLQSTVKDLVVQGGATLTSAEILPLDSEDNFQRIGIRVAFSGGLELLTSVLHGIETATPKLFVDNLDIRSAGGSDDDDASPALTISLEVHGFRAK